MTRWVLAMTGVLALGCGMGQPIPQRAVDLVSEDLAALAHPHASFVSATTTGWSKGSATTKTHDRYVDVEIVYQRKAQADPNTMTVRIYLENVDPCRVSLDVVADDGPTPLMLDNAISSAVVGDKICGAITP